MPRPAARAARTAGRLQHSTLYRRIPTLRAAANLDEIPFKHNGSVYGVYSLPVTCVVAAMEVFDQRDEDGVAVLLNPDPPASQADDVRQAAAVCPALAIHVTD